MTKNKGLGDDLKKVFDAIGITKVVEKTTELLGIEDCGCTRRQEILNQLFPYKIDIPQELIPQNEDDFEEGIYIINNNLVFTRQGVTYDYKVGDRIFIKQDHPYFQDFKQYYKIGIISKK